MRFSWDAAVVAALLAISCGGGGGATDGSAGGNGGSGTAGNAAGGSGGRGGGAAGNSGGGGAQDGGPQCLPQDTTTHTTGSFAAKLDGTPMRDGLTWNFTIATPSMGAGVTVSSVGLPNFNVHIDHCATGTFIEREGTQSGVSMTLSDAGKNWACRFDVAGSTCTVDVTQYDMSSGGHIRGTFSGTLTSLLVQETPPTRTISEGSFDLAIP